MEVASFLVAVREQVLELAEPEAHHFVVERRRGGESRGGESSFGVQLLLEHAVVEQAPALGLQPVGELIVAGLGGCGSEVD